MQLSQQPAASGGRVKLTKSVMRLADELQLKHMLRILGSKTMSRLDWNLACRISSPRFHKQLKFLLKEKYVERIKRGVYKRTEAGRQFAEMI